MKNDCLPDSVPVDFEARSSGGRRLRTVPTTEESRDNAGLRQSGAGSGAVSSAGYTPAGLESAAAHSRREGDRPGNTTPP